MATVALPVPIRLNNPGKLTRGVRRFHGALNKRVDEDGLIGFTAPEWGIHALAQTLLTLQRGEGVARLDHLLRLLRPDEPRMPNMVARALACRPDARVALQDPAALLLLVQAIIRFENGPPPGETRRWYPVATVARGIGMALGTVSPPAG
jgi:hypothetical protein